MTVNPFFNVSSQKYFLKDIFSDIVMNIISWYLMPVIVFLF